MGFIKYNIIVAKCVENDGIGYKGDLPWKLRSDLKHFAETTTRVTDPTKQNVVIAGRNTFFSIPAKNRPLVGRLNIVLSRTLKQSEVPDGVLLFRSLDGALEFLDNAKDIETVWIIGGSRVYTEALSKTCRIEHIFLTEIYTRFKCDVFFPTIPSCFTSIMMDMVDHTMKEEDGVEFTYKVLSKRQ